MNSLKEFGKLCSERNIKRRFTTADSPEYNGVAERGLAMIESAALAARIQGAMSWACDARTTTTANPGTPSLYEMF